MHVMAQPPLLCKVCTRFSCHQTIPPAAAPSDTECVACGTTGVDGLQQLSHRHLANQHVKIRNSFEVISQNLSSRGLPQIAAFSEAASCCSCESCERQTASRHADMRAPAAATKDVIHGAAAKSRERQLCAARKVFQKTSSNVPGSFWHCQS